MNVGHLPSLCDGKWTRFGLRTVSYPVAVSGFVDKAQCNVAGGHGGAGCVSFRREAHVPRGGPDGGDGGKGGDVWLRANRNVASLLAFRDHPHRKAGSGTHGQGKKLHGKNGTDLVVEVPEGTIVRAQDGELVADLLRHGDQWLAARGGQGGRGNARFLSNARRAPTFAEQGEYGEEQWLTLELKLIADAALVGFPNAGKSTLISAVSAAKPKIADYPFTTLHPQLGVVRVDTREFVLADLPGLIEGAHEGTGLGDRFLGHTERCRVLLHLVDGTSENAGRDYKTIRAELEAYGHGLEDKPEIVALTKADAMTPEQIKSQTAKLKRASGETPYVLSSHSGQGVQDTLRALMKVIEGARAPADAEKKEAAWQP